MSIFFVKDGVVEETPRPVFHVRGVTIYGGNKPYAPPPVVQEQAPAHVYTYDVYVPSIEDGHSDNQSSSNQQSKDIF
jgi:hypothetical protein